MPLESTPVTNTRIAVRKTTSKRSALPPVGTTIGDMAQFLESVREQLEVRDAQRGSPLDASPTFKDLIDAGVITTGGVSINGREYTVDQIRNLLSSTTPDWVTSELAPPPPTNVVVTLRETSVLVEWSDIASTFTNYSHTEVWRATANNLSTAVKMYWNDAASIVDALPPANTQYFYWIRHVSRAGIVGGFHGISGASWAGGTPATVSTGTISTVDGDILLNWSEPASNIDIKYYVVYALDAENDPILPALGRSNTTWFYFTPTAGGTYRFGVLAIPMAGAEPVAPVAEQMTPFVITLAALSAPVGLSYRIIGNKIELSWGAPANANSGATARLSGYNIRQIVAGSDITHAGTAVDALPNTITLAASATDPTGQVIALTGGTGSGQERVVTAYAEATNLLQRSEEFDNSYWTKHRASVTANSVIAPDGTLTADKLVEDTTASASHYTQRSGIAVLANDVITLSVFAKAGERTRIQLWFGVASPSLQVRANLATGQITLQQGVGTGTVLETGISAVGNGWHRLWVTGTMGTNGSYGWALLIADAGGSAFYTGDGTSGVYIWGAQLEQSSTLGPYIATTSASASGKVVVVDRQWATNLLQRSEEFDHATWSKEAFGVASAPVVTANAGIAPDGTLTADRIQLALNGGSSTGDISQIIQSYSGYTAGQPYVFSVWLKSNTGANQTIVLTNYNTQGANITVTPDWQRFERIVTPVVTTGSSAGIHIRGGMGMSDSADLLAWGAQLEASGAVGDYIATGAAAVTLPDTSTTYEIKDPLAGYSGALVQTVGAHTEKYRIPVDFYAGARTFFVYAVDTAAVRGELARVDVSVSVVAAPGSLTATIKGEDIELSWGTPTSLMPLAEYEVQYGDAGFAWGAGTPLPRISGNSLFVRPSWNGTKEFKVRAYDINGNAGQVSSVSFTIAAHAAPSGFRADVVDNNVLLYWTPAAQSANQLPVKAFEVRRGNSASTWATATPVGTKQGSFTTIFEATSGTYRYHIAAVDSGNQYGASASVLATVAQPPDYILNASLNELIAGIVWDFEENTVEGWAGVNTAVTAADTVLKLAAATSTDPQLILATPPTPDGRQYFYGCEWPLLQVKIRRTAGTGTQARAYYARTDANGANARSYHGSFYKDSDLALPAIADGWKVLTFDMSNLTAGTTDWSVSRITGIRLDFGDTIGDAFEIDWIRALPFKVSNMGWDDLSGVLAGPFNFSRTFQQHFDDNAWATGDAKIAAGYDQFLQPSAATGWIEKVIDYGTELPGMKLTSLPTFTALDGTVTQTPTISLSNTSAVAGYTDNVGQNTVFGVGFRWAKIRWDFTTSGGNDTINVAAFNTKTDAKIRNDMGTGTANSGDSGGTTVTFNVAFVDVQSITVTPSGTAARYAIYDFTDVPNPTSFKVLLFDNTGARVSGGFSWAARGY